MGRKRIMTLVVMCMVLAGCGAKGAPVTEETDALDMTEEVKMDSGTPKVGITLYSLQNEYTARFAKAADICAEQMGVELLIYDGNYDAALQITQVEEMVEQGVDGIILIPQDASKCSECVDKAADAQIPILSVNTKVDNERITSYVGSDDVRAGELLMEQMAESLKGKGNVVILEGPMGQSAQEDRIQGIKDILKQYPDIHIIGKKTANWSRLEAKTVMTGWIAVFDTIDGVIAENDDMALGAVEALAKAQKQCVVVGVDGAEDALAAVRDGRMDMTVYQDAEEQAEEAIQVILKKIQGEEIQSSYLIPLQKVTKMNIEEYEE